MVGGRLHEFTADGRLQGFVMPFNPFDAKR